jgi:NAD(P)-dependent dehydrogenase (short-subunit alcohol dehydrogenase family)
VRRILRQTLDNYGHWDALEHNAGEGGSKRPLARLDDDDARSILATNLIAPIELTRALLPSMVERRRGAIVFVASVVGHVAIPGSTLYSATKFGLRGFAIGLRRELWHSGIGVTIVSPGFIDTAMASWLHGFPKAPPALVARVIADAIERPRREVVAPGPYRLVIWLEQILPWLADAVLSRRVR